MKTTSTLHFTFDDDICPDIDVLADAKKNIIVIVQNSHEIWVPRADFAKFARLLGDWSDEDPLEVQP